MGQPGEAVVLGNGKVAARFALEGHGEYKVEGALGDSIIEIKNGKVKMRSSPCLQKTCVHQGYIEKSGECIICVPNQVVIKVQGVREEEALDAVSK